MSLPRADGAAHDVKPRTERQRQEKCSALGARRSALGARRSALGARRSALGARRSALGARRSALGARRSALGARRSALGARRSALGGARRSALGARHSVYHKDRFREPGFRHESTSPTYLPLEQTCVADRTSRPRRAGPKPTVSTPLSRESKARKILHNCRYRGAGNGAERATAGGLASARCQRQGRASTTRTCRTRATCRDTPGFLQTCRNSQRKSFSRRLVAARPRTSRASTGSAAGCARRRRTG